MMINFYHSTSEIFLTFLVLLLAIAIDLIVGELPTKIHTVVIIGKLIDFFTKKYIKIRNSWSGLLLAISVTIVIEISIFLILLFSTINIYIFLIVSSIILSTTFSIKLLLSSVNDIKNDLLVDISIARKSLSYLVSRHVDQLSEKLIISASLETLSENLTDSVVSVFFYFLLSTVLSFLIILFFGEYSISYNFANNNLINNNLINNYFNNFTNNFIPYIFTNNTFISEFLSINVFKLYNLSNSYGLNNLNLFYTLTITSTLIAIFYRVINTLDAMVGYKNQKFKLIGYFSAKFDDILNFMPSRFSGFVVVISAMILKLDWKNSYRILKRDTHNCNSPNSGYTIAATAGALNIQLEKKDAYIMGDVVEKLNIKHISRGIKLIKLTIFLSLAVLIAIFSSITLILLLFL
jgi:adenosylcobinamide-phosphate synthase